MEPLLLLESYLKQLHLPTFVRNYRSFAEDGARSNLSYDRFLLALAEQEVNERTRKREMLRIKEAHFPVLKELADFDFSCVPSSTSSKCLPWPRGTTSVAPNPFFSWATQA